MLHLWNFLSSDEAHAKIQLRRQLTALHHNFYLGWPLPMKSSISKTLSERLHRAPSRHLLSGKQIDLAWHCKLLHARAIGFNGITHGSPASGDLLAQAPAGARELAASAPPHRECSQRWWLLQEECAANLHEHPQPAARTGKLKKAL